VYHKTANFPKEELYTLVSQMRRSAISIPGNIAEGAARRSRKELLNFLNIASGSASELDTQFVIAQRLGFLPEADPIIEELDHVSAQLGAMMRSLRDS
jgi:four helix bundle protein